MEQWVSVAKVKKMFDISSEKLNELESEGKVKTMLAVGSRKLYLLSSFQGHVQPAKKENKKGFISKLLSWMGFK